MYQSLTQASRQNKIKLKKVAFFQGKYNFIGYICSSNHRIALINYCGRLAKPALKDFICRKSPSSHRRTKKGLLTINLFKMVNQVYLSGSNFSYQINATSDSGESMLLLQYLVAKHHHDFLQMQLQMPKRTSSMINPHYKVTCNTNRTEVLIETFNVTFHSRTTVELMERIYSLNKTVING